MPYGRQRLGANSLRYAVIFGCGQKISTKVLLTKSQEVR